MDCVAEGTKDHYTDKKHEKKKSAAYVGAISRSS
jgi:hypothetical protein